MEIAFGYYGSTACMVHRHAFFISPEGTIVDPTAISYDQSEDSMTEKDYIIFKSLSRDEYSDYLMTDNYTSLNETMKPYEKELYEWLVKNGVMLVAGQDYDEYLKEFDKERRIYPLYEE